MNDGFYMWWGGFVSSNFDVNMKVRHFGETNSERNNELFLTDVIRTQIRLDWSGL